MLQLYSLHASSRLACRDIQRIQRIQRIQLYSYTRYTAYSIIQPPSVKRAGRSCYNADYLGMGPRAGGGAGIINYQPGRPAGRRGGTG